MIITTYRTKQTVEGTQWDGTFQGALPIMQWVQANSDQDVKYGEFFGGPRIVLETEYGIQQVSPGDSIIKGVFEDFFRARADTFADTYEAVNETPTE